MFWFRLHLFVAIASIALVGCAVGPDFHSPVSPRTGRYIDSPLPKRTVRSPGPGGKSQRFVPGRDIPPQWWLLFHSKELNNLIYTGIVKSPNLDAAVATLHQAQENMRVGIGALFPLVTAQFSAQRQRFAGATIGTPNILNNTFNLFSASINVSYNLDIFGGVRRQIEALGALVEYQGFQTEAAYLTLTANIVTTAVTAASFKEQITATQDIIRLLERQLRIVRSQFELGSVSRAEVLAQETQLAQTRATLPPLQKSLTQSQHALSVLVGALPSERRLPGFSLNALHLPRDLPLSLPSFLVCQRPDVRASQALMHQASALIGVATANLLPQFTLSGDYGSTAPKIGQLFNPEFITWTIAGQVIQTLFNGGALHAKRRAAIAAYEQAFAQYRQVVLQAFQNVADALRAIEIDARTLRAQTAAEAAARATLILTENRLKLGSVNYLALLDAQRQYQQTRIARIQAQAARYTDTAALFQALGGGWWNRGDFR